jgi:hypothetical protein
MSAIEPAELKSMATEEVSRKQQMDDSDARELNELGYHQQLNVRGIQPLHNLGVY